MSPRSPRRSRSQNRLLILWAALLLFAALIIPTIIVKIVRIDITARDTDHDLKPSYELPIVEHAQEPLLLIPVYLSQQGHVVDVPLEWYVRGVVAAEMPVEFELQALKAQAIAARTYIVRKIIEQDFAKAPVPDAWVSDTIADQAYVTEDELRTRWPRNGEYAANISKFNRAVAETRGLILAYEGRPIDATYFSTSNGYTENSEEYWSEPIPYLRSVASPWDAEISPRYKTVTTLPLSEVMEKLDLHDLPVSASHGSKLGLAVAERTSGNRIKTILINGLPFSGREVREKLGLPSSQFTWEIRDDLIEFTSYGYGHGVGMSQYGAQGMALEGRTAEEILRHYYQDVEIVHMKEIDGWQEHATIRQPDNAHDGKKPA